MPQRAVRPQPFVVVAPRSVAPVVLCCEHAHASLPDRVRPSTVERRVLRSHWGWDPGAWPLTVALARRLDTSAIGGGLSRLWIDLNRHVADDTLVRRRAGGVELSWNAGLDHADRERRIRSCHAPYHDRLDELIVARLVRGVRPLVFAVHSFTPELHGRTRDYEIGVLYDRDAPQAHRLGRSLREAGLRVRYNQPYSGKRGMMYSADRHGTHHRLRCLELEINQGSFTTARSVRSLAAAVAPALAALGRGD